MTRRPTSFRDLIRQRQAAVRADDSARSAAKAARKRADRADRRTGADGPDDA